VEGIWMILGWKRKGGSRWVGKLFLAWSSSWSAAWVFTWRLTQRCFSMYVQKKIKFATEVMRPQMGGGGCHPGTAPPTSIPVRLED